MRSPFRNLYWPAISSILLIALALRTPNLNESLWNDEIWSTRVLLGSVASLYQNAIEDLHPPLYQVFMFGWIRLFGDSELSVRTPPLLLGIASIFLLYALISRIVERKTALLASFFMAASPAHIWYSQEARSYSSLLFFLLLSLLAYLKLKERDPRLIWFFVYFGALFSCVLSHYFMGVYALLFSLICLLERHPKRKQILLINLSTLACLAAWIMTKVALTGMPIGGGYLRGFDFRELWRLLFGWFLFGGVWKEYLYPREIFVVQLFFLALFLYGLALLLLRKGVNSAADAWPLPMFLFALPVFLLIATPFGYKIYIQRSVFVALPFMCIVIAKGMIGLGEASASKRLNTFGGIFMRTLAAACFLAVITMNVFTIKEYFRREAEYTVYKPNPDWRSVSHYLEQEISRATDPVMMFAVVSPLELIYYNSRFRNIWLGDAGGQDVMTGEDAQKYWGIYCIRPDQLAAVRAALVKTGAKEFYLIHNRFWSGDLPGVFTKIMEDPKFQAQSRQTYKGLEIYKVNVHEYKN